MTPATLCAEWTELVGAVAALVAIPVTLLVGWWGWRAAVPHRKIAYASEVTPLSPSPESSRAELGTENPHKRTLKIINTGNREVDATHFNGEPIDFDMHTRIVSVLSVYSSGYRREPPATINGRILQVHPYAIHKGQEITYQLLLEGPGFDPTPRHTLSGHLVKYVPPSGTEGVRMAATPWG